jgi:hypothetical protein
MAELDKSKPVSLEELMLATLAQTMHSRSCWLRRASSRTRSSSRSCWRSVVLAGATAVNLPGLREVGAGTWITGVVIQIVSGIRFLWIDADEMKKRKQENEKGRGEKGRPEIGVA